MRPRRSRPLPAVPSSAFKGFRFPPEIIVLAVRWNLRYALSYRDVEELLGERGIKVDHVTIYRWVQRFAPLLANAAGPCRHSVGDRWFVDETYVKIAGKWRYARLRPMRGLKRDHTARAIMRGHALMQNIRRGHYQLTSTRTDTSSATTTAHPSTLRCSPTRSRRSSRDPGLPRIRLHDLRHTHATLLLKAGVPIKIVSERLGHSTPAFTMATYQTRPAGHVSRSRTDLPRDSRPLHRFHPVEHPVERPRDAARPRARRCLSPAVSMVAVADLADRVHRPVPGLRRHRLSTRVRERSALP
jgi:Phage integrase family